MQQSPPSTVTIALCKLSRKGDVFAHQPSSEPLGAGEGEAHGGSGIEAAAFLFCCSCNFNVLNLNARVQSRSHGVAPELDERLKNSRMR